MSDFDTYFLAVLPLNKLNLQFLTFHDYLLRNFNLFQLESTCKFYLKALKKFLLKIILKMKFAKILKI